jgi:hypothetical protein
MGSARVVICGLARNVAEVLPATIGAIERLGSAFADYRVVLYENDSHDRTPELLSGWAAVNRRVTALSQRRGDPVNRPIRCLERAARMACYRNQYLNFVRRTYRDYDYVIVVDTDLGGEWNEAGIAITFGHDDWDFVGSYGILHRLSRQGFQQVHYDAWAYRLLGSDTAIPTKIANRFMPTQDQTLIPVNSCFGGLGIYRMASLVASHYGGSDCEHVTLHRGMREAGHARLYLNCEQTTYYGVRRVSNSSTWDSLRTRLRSMSRRMAGRAA